MPWAECMDCGGEFWREDDEPWKVRCFPCWREHKNRRGGVITSEGLRRQAEIQRLRDTIAALEATMACYADLAEGLRYHLTFLIFAAHPDRNNNDPRANDATRWLLEVREFLKNLKQA